MELMDKPNSRSTAMWDRAVELVPKIYAVARRLPSGSDANLGVRMREAAVSVADNIALGQAQPDPRDFLQHLSLAKGSLAELQDLLILAGSMECLSALELRRLETAITELFRPLQRLDEVVLRQSAINDSR